MRRNREANGSLPLAQMTSRLPIPFLRSFLLACTLFTMAPSAGATNAPRTILILGDSLTAGYGLDDPMTMAFPARLEEKIRAQGLNYRVVNAGLSGETSAGGLRRVDWVLRQPVDIFILALGGNDGLRGLPAAVLQENLSRIFDKVRTRNPRAQLVIAGMQMPRSMGGYAQDFAAVFPEVAQRYDATLIPFLLEAVGGVRELNLPDGIHPTAEGHARMAETVWQHLRPLL
jgi:acyl-CoA thioesterase I